MKLVIILWSSLSCDEILTLTTANVASHIKLLVNIRLDDKNTKPKLSQDSVTTTAVAGGLLFVCFFTRDRCS